MIEWVAEARGRKALAQALQATERRIDDLRSELDVLRRGRSAGGRRFYVVGG